ELNAILREFVESVRAILGDNFCGAYLQGSFALGDADEDSDVDFIIVTHDEVTDAQLHALRDMHRRIYELPSPWAQHLEGSYVTKERLRRVDPRTRHSSTSTTAPPSSSATRTATPPPSAGPCPRTASSSPDQTRRASSRR